MEADWEVALLWHPIAGSVKRSALRVLEWLVIEFEATAELTEHMVCMQSPGKAASIEREQ